jgi:hypothetical protein
MRWIFFALVFFWAASAQVTDDELRSKIEAVRYPILAEQARIQGDVRLSVKSGAITPLSGHPLLARTAVESARAFGSIQGRTDLDLTYHFVLVDAASMPTSVTVPRGNPFKRSVLRVFGLKTEKVVLKHRCQEGVPPAHDLKLVGAVVEITIYGRVRCLQTQAVTVAAKR